MNFTSIEFCILFLTVFAVYYMLRCRMQNYLLLAASYLFYGWWDWRFMGLLLFQTLVSYFAGLRIGNSADPRERKRYLRRYIGYRIKRSIPAISVQKGSSKMEEEEGLAIYLLIYLRVYLSVYLIYRYLSFDLIGLFIHSSVYLSIHILICLSIYRES